MKIIIIEDEKPAAEKLIKGIQKINPAINITVVLNSIATSVDWLQQNPMPDLIFMDIQLGDGISFKIFDSINITCPVIFCTAFDEYWQDAFEYNSIDYLLKPVKQEKLDAAFKKYKNLKEHFATNFQRLQEWQQQPIKEEYKKRFLVKKGTDYISIKAEEIAYFYATHKLICMVSNTNQKFLLDQSLTDIEKQLNPSVFYRVNRKYLVNLAAIKKIRSLTKSKLQLYLEPLVEEEIIISQENASTFKEWMGQ